MNGSFTAGKSTYDISPLGSRQHSANFPSLTGGQIKRDMDNEDGLILKDGDLNFPITKKKNKCKC